MKFLSMLLVFSIQAFAFEAECTPHPISPFWDNPNSIVLNVAGGGYGRHTGVSYPFVRFYYNDRVFQKIEIIKGVEYEIVNDNPLIYKINFLHKRPHRAPYEIECFVNVLLQKKEA